MHDVPYKNKLKYYSQYDEFVRLKSNLNVNIVIKCAKMYFIISSICTFHCATKYKLLWQMIYHWKRIISL